MKKLPLSKIIDYLNDVNKKYGTTVKTTHAFLLMLKNLGIENVTIKNDMVSVYFEKNISPKMLLILIKNMTSHEPDNAVKNITFDKNVLTMPLGFWGMNDKDVRSIMSYDSPYPELEKRGVTELRNDGYTIYVSRLNEKDTLYEVEKDNIEYNVVKFANGDYHVQNGKFGGYSKKSFKTLKNAVKSGYNYFMKNGGENV
jgi:hypothetical protein